jgi:hypothetical protein
VFSCTTPTEIQRNTVCSSTDHNATNGDYRISFSDSNPTRQLISYIRTYSDVPFTNEEI